MRCTLFASDKGDVPANLAFTNNYAGNANPAVTNDASQGYSVGSSWVNLSTGTAYQCLDATIGAAVWALDAQGSGLGQQVTPATQDTAGTLTAAQMQTGLITSNPAGAVNLQLPLATAMDTALPLSAANSSLDFSIVNIAGSANTATVTTNTGWTLVGSMAVAQNVSGRFRARKTGAGAWTLYRIS